MWQSIEHDDGNSEESGPVSHIAMGQLRSKEHADDALLIC